MSRSSPCLFQGAEGLKYRFPSTQGAMLAEIQRYSIKHKTHYEYSAPSSLCHNQTHLRPRELAYQRVHQSYVEISPKPDSRSLWCDSFGNQVEFFSIEHLHPNLTVTARSVVERSNPEFDWDTAPTWNEVKHSAHNYLSLSDRVASEFLHDSRHCQRAPIFIEFAKSIAKGENNVLECVRELNTKIFRELQYSPTSTHVSTPPAEAIEKRQGVCQDFAHIAICCLRSLGIPARYVSGYLLTRPAPGKEKLIGADASHAWFSVYAGHLGWIDFDPTNNMVPGKEHITLAWGRDYTDVAPIQGVFVGGGYTMLTVSVDVHSI